MNPTAPPFRAYLAEVLGTFMLVFAGTGAMIVDDLFGGVVTPVGIAVTFGLVVLAVVYAVGEVSGAHINPAVTFGFWVSGRFSGRHVGPYVLAQTLGAVGASLLLKGLFPAHGTLGGTHPAGPVGQSFVLEIVLTFLLMFVILCVAVGAKEKGLMAGVAVGATVCFVALFGGPVSGASMNPARSLAPALVTGAFEAQWIYVVAPLVGAALAVLAYRGVYGHATRPPTSVPEEPTP